MIMAFLQSFAGAVAARAAYYRTLDELRKLTDRDLQDIGLNRGEIYEVAAGAAVDPNRGRPNIALTSRSA